MARPNLSYLKNLLLFLCGLPCGAFTGLTGMGTSVVVLPLQRYLLALRGPRAGATALAVTFFAAFTGLLSYAQNHDIRGGIAVVLALGQFWGAAWGQRVVASVPGLTRLNVVWAVIVGVIGLTMSANALGFGPKGLPGLNWSLFWLPDVGIWYWGAVLVTSVLVGLASRVVGLGGVLLVPAAIYLLHFTPQAAQGTALLVLALASLPSVLVYARRGEIELQSATWMSVGSVFGALLGAYWAVRILPTALLVLIYGVALMLIGLSLLWRRPIAVSEPDND
jgi:uncharacterized membrane protein YfcA